MSKLERPVLYMNTYTCVHCGASKLSPTLPKGWKEFCYLDTTDNYGNTWQNPSGRASSARQYYEEFKGSTVVNGASFSSNAEDTTGKKIYFPPVLPSSLKSLTAGTVAWEASLAWDHPSGVSAKYNPSATYEKKMSSIGYYEDVFDHKVSAGVQINEDHYLGVDNVFEKVHLTALQKLDWNIWEISGKYVWKLPAGFRLEPRVRYRDGSGEDDMDESFGANLWEEELRLAYAKEGVVDGHVSFASIQMNKRDGVIPYQMMSGFGEGVTYRLETMVSVDVNRFLSLSLRYILRFGDAEENVFQKLASEARAYF